MEFVKTTRGCLMEKLALIPTTKLIVEDFLEVDTSIPPETLALRFSWGDKKALAINTKSLEQTLNDIRPPFNFAGSTKDFTH